VSRSDAELAGVMGQNGFPRDPYRSSGASGRLMGGGFEPE
jgi:hypothetical protein